MQPNLVQPEKLCTSCGATSPRHWSDTLCPGDAVLQRLGPHRPVHDVAGRQDVEQVDAAKASAGHEEQRAEHDGTAHNVDLTRGGVKPWVDPLEGVEIPF